MASICSRISFWLWSEGEVNLHITPLLPSCTGWVHEKPLWSVLVKTGYADRGKGTRDLDLWRNNVNTVINAI